MNEKIIIIGGTQFGYHVDSYYWCKYLSEHYKVTYVCYDFKKPKMNLNGVEVIYIERTSMKIKHFINYHKAIQKEIRKGSEIIIVRVSIDSFILKLQNLGQKMILDIRTGSVSKNYLKRIKYNFRIWFQSIFFNNITIISEGLSKKLALPQNKIHVLPIGGNEVNLHISNNNLHISNNKKINILYIGTLNSRNLIQTIIGFNLFIQTEKRFDITYTIIGDGSKEETEVLLNYINNNNLSDKVFLKGYVPNEELSAFLCNSDIGVSFIPITSYYMYQPPRKTFEYLFAGLPVIATSTYENKIVINNRNGVLIKDNAESFCAGLSKIIMNSGKFNASEIRKTVNQYNWENIINNNLRPYIESIINS